MRFNEQGKSPHEIGNDGWLVPRLGPLERRVVDSVWRLDSATVRTVLADLNDEPAYTTVMTTLDRLYKKGYLDRELKDRAYVYRPAMSFEEMRFGFAGRIIAGLIQGTKTPQPVLSCLVDAVSESDHQLLDELESLVKAKKAEREKK